ncbi:efflux RND transporter permease subunit [Cohnella caldifontis]|uniref:efflux RND transporter permease subunit n=1 Tax=Cohnella caldifontis TaxID=3027471 RepID=UPI0023ECFEF7|nr:efflux RND transporter permease subunit [Cohnella sp. YIM B05605]
MNKWIETVMQRAAVLIVILVMILAWGVYAAVQMKRDYLPGIDNTTLMVSLRASSLQADQIQRDVAAPLEDAIRATDGIADIETTSYDGGLLMNLYYPMDFDMAKAENQIKQAVSEAGLPTGVNPPSVTRLTSSSFPILSYSLTSNGNRVDDVALQSTVQAEIVRQLKSVPGVSDVQTVGGAKSGYVVTLRNPDLAKYGLTVDDFNKSVAASLPVLQGYAANVKASLPIRIVGWDSSEERLKSLPIRNSKGDSVPLTAVADLGKSLNDVKTVARTDGKASVLIQVVKSPSANITTVARQVKDRVAGLSAVENGDVSMNLLLDRAFELNASLLGLVREGILGCLFSMLCVLFFFRDVRSTLLIAVSLPISLLAATAVLKSMGVSLNILTVSGLIVAMGRIVDDAIVIMDNMYRRVQERTGEPRLRVLASSAAEMLPAILGSTATTIAVYAPIALVGGIVGASYSGFAWSVVIALAVSFLTAMLVIPTLAYRGWREPKGKTVTLEPVMKPLLSAALRHKKTAAAISLIVFLAAAGFATRLPFNLLPASATGQAAIKLELPQGSPLPVVDREVRKVEAVLRSDPRVASFSSTFGSSFTPQADDVFDQGGGYIQKANVANLSVELKNEKEANSFISSMQSALPAVSKIAVITVTNQNIAGDDSQMKIMLSGADARTLDDAARTVRTGLSGIRGLSVDGKADLTNGNPKYDIVIDADKVRSAGVSEADLNQVLNRYLAKAKDFEVPAAAGPIPVDVYLDNAGSGPQGGGEVPVYAPERLMASLGAETFTGTSGAVYRFDQLAAIRTSDAVTAIQERDGQPYAVVTAQITSGDVSGVARTVQNTLKGLVLPAGVTYTTGGITQQVGEMAMEMTIAILVSIVLVLLIVSFLFKGWKAPLAVLLSIPMALSGVVLALYADRGQWNLAALAGALMLTGIVVTNGIVMIDKIERNRREGMDLREAVFQGALSRVRPIFMTAGTTVLTLLPLALSRSSDTVVSQVLGIVVIGGMVTSTLNSFAVIPMLYEWMHGKSMKTEQRLSI